MRKAVLAAALLIALVGWMSAPARAQGQPQSPTLTGQEIDKEWNALKGQGWKKGDLELALRICKGDRELFATYKGLFAAKVPPPVIEASFNRCKGVPGDVTDYWDYINAKRFSPQEVDEFFKVCPPNKMTRFYYFSYRAGGVANGLVKLDERGKSKVPKAAVKIQKYSQEECMRVWTYFKFDVAYAKEYFERRDKGEDPKKVWPEMKQRFDKKIHDEIEAQEKQKAEEQAKANETLEIKKKLTEQEAKIAAEKTKQNQKEKVQQVSANDLEAILSGNAPAAAAPEKKDEAKPEAKQEPKPETKQETKPAEVQCPKCNKLVKPDVTDPAKPCCPECKTPLEIKQTPPPADATQQKQGEGEQKPAADQPAKETPKEGEKAAQ